MEPVLTPAEMAAVDAAAPEPVTELIDRAARAVTRTAIEMLGSTYGRRVVVFAGKGNNGEDGRVAAVHLEQRGVRCEVLPPDGTPRHRPDLVIDACVGTGLGRPFAPPPALGSPVLAVDIPSGVDGLTGEIRGAAVRADVTVTFAARKPGLLFDAGREHAGRVEVADIGLALGTPTMWLMTDDDLDRWPERRASAHKWNHAVWLIGGQPGMSGALSLAGEAAARAGAGYVALSTPGGSPSGHREAVTVDLPGLRWDDVVGHQIDRYGAVVIGPGLRPGSSATALAAVIGFGIPTVIDAGAIDLVANDPSMVQGQPVVLTPHDGEFERLTGARPRADRVASARATAAELGAVVLLKGPTTVVASPDGEIRIIMSGDARLATAGTGDVLSGIIGAGLASGLSPIDAASIGAQLHGRAAAKTERRFPLASDLLDHLLD